CLASILWAFVFLTRSTSGQAARSLGGALASIAALLRFNAVVAPLVALRLVRRRPVSMALALAPGVAWVAISAIVKQVPFWVPSSRGASAGFHPDFLPRHRYQEQLLAESPLEFFLRAAYRGLISGPIEVGRSAAGIPWPLLLALIALSAFLLV